jgi:hypothetical protein
MEFKRYKIVRSENYNYNFDRVTGEFARWGKTLEDDPPIAPAPEILDLEISTICNGPTGKKPCQWCYKSNTNEGKNMDFETFKKIFHKININKIKIYLEDTIIEVDPSQKITLISGAVVNAEDLTKGDEVLIIEN